jgi:WD40 repeat protein
VTQVKFAPHQHSKLISAAVDGLICVFDTDGDMNEDNHLLSVCFSCFLCPNALSYISCYVRLWFDTLMFVVY